VVKRVVTNLEIDFGIFGLILMTKHAILFLENRILKKKAKV